uniref:Uncharacterized LOC100178919 n=1 Tax=Ciona intestinalis TaxID=7719 RepID=H2Y157_CIOIN|nr:uncharacterized protein LOC100178919 [Ciona intestinalis]|eukprot:XP_026693358.1 uncharacterized protein LOC100178919 [Ciona intestinalis]
MSLQSKLAQNVDTENSLHQLHAQNSQLKQRTEIQAAKIKEYKDTLVTLTKKLEAVKSEASMANTDVLNTERLYRQKEELKISMVSKNCQTNARLVIQRDIAWIRVAEEEVLLSPHCGDSASGKFHGEKHASPNLPVGATTPIFEVYNIGNNDEREEVTRNKRLVDEQEDSEFIWTSYE